MTGLRLHAREALAADLGIHPDGRRFRGDLAWLRTMGVVTDKGPLEPTEALFR